MLIARSDVHVFPHRWVSFSVTWISFYTPGMVDLANPDAPYNHTVDLGAGFSAAAKQFSETIVTPQIGNGLTRDLLMSLEDLEAVKKCFLRLSHERWTGRRDMISREECRYENG